MTYNLFSKGRPKVGSLRSHLMSTLQPNNGDYPKPNGGIGSQASLP